MNLTEILKKTTQKFIDAGISTPELDAEVIISHILDIERHILITDDSRELPEKDVRKISGSVKRRLQGEPVAYITGVKEFYSLELSVTKDVLIPRPETELLVDLAIFHAPQRASVVDIGTGSGAIAIAIKHNRNDLEIYASDISEKALRVARKNTRNVLGKQKSIMFSCGNLFLPFTDMKFDLIISNPPYIDEQKKDLLQKEISYEPERALFAADKGFAEVKRIIRESREHLNEKGQILMEIGEDMKELVRENGEKLGYSVSILSDYAGLPRIAILQ